MLLLLLQATGTAPSDCILTGLCGAEAPWRPIPSGILYVAVGLVGFGIWGLRRYRATRR
jgi:hypothetical protein